MLIDRLPGQSPGTAEQAVENAQFGSREPARFYPSVTMTGEVEPARDAGLATCFAYSQIEIMHSAMPAMMSARWCPPMEIVETIIITETGKAGQNAHVLRKDQSSKTGTIV